MKIRTYPQAAAYMIEQYGSRDKAMNAATDHAMSCRYEGRVHGEGYWLAVYRAILRHRMPLSAADIAARQADYPKARD